MPTSVSVGFKNDMSAQKAMTLGSPLTAFATGAAREGIKIFDEKRQHQQDRALAQYKSDLAAGNIRMQLNEEEKIAIATENREAKIATLNKKRSAASFKELGIYNGVKPEASDIYAEMMVNVDPKIAGKMSDRFVDQANTKYRAQELTAIDPSVRTPAEKEELHFYNSGGTAKTFQENAQALAVKAAGGAGNLKNQIDQPFAQLTGGMYPNTYALQAAIDTERGQLSASGVGPSESRFQAIQNIAGSAAQKAGFTPGTPEYEARVEQIVQYGTATMQDVASNEPAPVEQAFDTVINDAEQMSRLSQKDSSGTYTNYPEIQSIVNGFVRQGRKDLAKEFIRKIRNQ